ncbi:hypothetical protein [Mycoplasma sp. ATU-Cv-508]|uniref:hypothetical protein n=1 Tax=Mycoplasma sp. ATU-Cv-508 TaxID=2048001 RepID=UPI000FDE8FC8
MKIGSILVKRTNKFRRLFTKLRLPFLLTSSVVSLVGITVGLTVPSASQSLDQEQKASPNSNHLPERLSLRTIESNWPIGSEQSVLIWHEDFSSPWVFAKTSSDNQIGGHLTDLDHQLNLEKIYDIRPSDLAHADQDQYYLASESASELVYRSVDWFYLNHFKVSDFEMESPLEFDPSSETGIGLISEKIDLPVGLTLEILSQSWLSQTEEQVTYRIGRQDEWSKPRQFTLTYAKSHVQAIEKWLESIKGLINRQLSYQDYSAPNFDLTAWLKSVGTSLPAEVKIAATNYDLTSQSLEVSLTFRGQSLTYHLEECVLLEQPLAFPEELLNLLKIETQGFVGENFAFKFKANNGTSLWKLIQTYNPSWSVERLSQVGFYHRLKDQADWLSTQDFLAWINTNFDRLTQLINQRIKIETRFGSPVVNGSSKVTEVDWKKHVSPHQYWHGLARNWTPRSSYDFEHNSTNHLKSLLNHQGQELGIEAEKFGLKYLVSLSGSRRLTFGAAGARADLLVSKKWLTLQELKWVFDGSSQAGNLFDTLNNRAHYDSIEFALVQLDQQEPGDEALKIRIDNWLRQSQRIKKALDQKLIHEQLANFRFRGNSRHISGVDNPLDDWAIGRVARLKFLFDGGKRPLSSLLSDHSSATSKLQNLARSHWNIQLLQEIFDGSSNAPNLWSDSEKRWVFENLKIKISLSSTRYTLVGRSIDYALKLKNIGLELDQVQFAPKANELFKKLARIMRVEFDPSTPNRTRWNISEIHAIIQEIKQIFDDGVWSPQVIFGFDGGELKYSATSELVLKRDLESVRIADDPNTRIFWVRIKLTLLNVGTTARDVEADDEDFTVDGKKSFHKKQRLVCRRSYRFKIPASFS